MVADLVQSHTQVRRVFAYYASPLKKLRRVSDSMGMVVMYRYSACHCMGVCMGCAMLLASHLDHANLCPQCPCHKQVDQPDTQPDHSPAAPTHVAALEQQVEPWPTHAKLGVYPSTGPKRCVEPRNLLQV